MAILTGKRDKSGSAVTRSAVAKAPIDVKPAPAMQQGEFKVDSGTPAGASAPVADAAAAEALGTEVAAQLQRGGAHAPVV